MCVGQQILVIYTFSPLNKLVPTGYLLALFTSICMTHVRGFFTFNPINASICVCKGSHCLTKKLLMNFPYFCACIEFNGSPKSQKLNFFIIKEIF